MVWLDEILELSIEKLAHNLIVRHGAIFNTKLEAIELSFGALQRRHELGAGDARVLRAAGTRASLRGWLSQQALSSDQLFLRFGQLERHLI